MLGEDSKKAKSSKLNVSKLFQRKTTHERAASSGSSRAPATELPPETPPRSSSDVFWPASLLKDVCPLARILVWGYDTHITKGIVSAVNQNSLFSHAKDFLLALRRERDLDMPIIFIAHSLGGIVVKDMLAQSKSSEEAESVNILSSTSAVVFLGTPHRGSERFARVGDVARNVACAMLNDTNPAILDALGLRNSDLERCQDEFVRLWDKYGFQVKTFQEGKAVTGINLGILNEKVGLVLQISCVRTSLRVQQIVPNSSSAIGNPKEHAETLDADHIAMCRFSGPDDPNWRKFGPELRSIYRAIKPISQSEHAVQQPDPPDAPDPMG